MKPLKIWQPKDEKPAEEPQYYLRMVQGSDCMPSVRVVDECGEEVSGGEVLSFYANGMVYRSPGINPNLRLALDPNGRICVSGMKPSSD